MKGVKVRKVTKAVVSVMLVMCVVVLSGCQLDFQGPSATAKFIRKGENNNQEYLSRGSGMAGGNSYAAGGGNNAMTSNGQGGSIVSWGNAKPK